MKWLRSWLQPGKVWKRLSARFLFAFACLNVFVPILDLLPPPHRLQWRIGFILVFSLVFSVVIECLLFLMLESKPPNDP